eukprot:166361-Amphidinium_carterae.1
MPLESYSLKTLLNGRACEALVVQRASNAHQDLLLKKNISIVLKVVYLLCRGQALKKPSCIHPDQVGDSMYQVDDVFMTTPQKKLQNAIKM